MVFYWEVVDEKLKIDIYGEKIAPFGLYTLNIEKLTIYPWVNLISGLSLVLSQIGTKK